MRLTGVALFAVCFATSVAQSSRRYLPSGRNYQCRDRHGNMYPLGEHTRVEDGYRCTCTYDGRATILRCNHPSYRTSLLEHVLGNRYTGAAQNEFVRNYAAGRNYQCRDRDGNMYPLGEHTRVKDGYHCTCTYNGRATILRCNHPSYRTSSLENRLVGRNYGAVHSANIQSYAAGYCQSGIIETNSMKTKVLSSRTPSEFITCKNDLDQSHTTCYQCFEV